MFSSLSNVSVRLSKQKLSTASYANVLNNFESAFLANRIDYIASKIYIALHRLSKLYNLCKQQRREPVQRARRVRLKDQLFLALQVIIYIFDQRTGSYIWHLVWHRQYVMASWLFNSLWELSLPTEVNAIHYITTAVISVVLTLTICHCLNGRGKERGMYVVNRSVCSRDMTFV